MILVLDPTRVSTRVLVTSPYICCWSWLWKGKCCFFPSCTNSEHSCFSGEAAWVFSVSLCFSLLSVFVLTRILKESKRAAERVRNSVCMWWKERQNAREQNTANSFACACWWYALCVSCPPPHTHTHLFSQLCETTGKCVHDGVRAEWLMRTFSLFFSWGSVVFFLCIFFMYLFFLSFLFLFLLLQLMWLCASMQHVCTCTVDLNKCCSGRVFLHMYLYIYICICI